MIPKGLEIVHDRSNDHFFYLKNKEGGFDCQLCCRKHENENAYLFVTKKGIFFKCYRSPEKKLTLKYFLTSPPNSYIHTYKELIKDEFVDLIPKRCVRSSDVYLWNKENKLWKLTENDTLCSRISNYIQDFADKIIKTLENQREILVKKIDSMFPKSKEKLSQEVSKEKDYLQNQLSDCDQKLKAWKSYQKEASRSEYHYKIIQEIITHCYNKELLKKLDKFPNHIPIRDGKVVNFQTQEITERKKEHYFTFELDVVYNPQARPLANQALSKIMCRDEEMIKCLKKALIYGCLGTNDQKKIFVFYGPTSHNGKSFVFTIVRSILGPLFGDINQTLFKLSEAKANKPELLYLEKKRFTQITELKKEDKMDITFLKTISGRDTVNLRDNYASSDDVKDEVFDFVIYMMTNSFPDVVPDEALWKRFLFFPFDARFTSNNSEVNEDMHIYKDDKTLMDKFMKEEEYKSSTLNMLLEGAKLYFEERFNNIPDKCKDKTDGMKMERAEDQDPLTSFLNENFIIRNNQSRIERSKFNKYVTQYSKIKFNKNFKSSVINESMRQKGVGEKKSDGIYYFLDISVNQELFERWIEGNRPIIL
jgi:phage/plasmid-associated DNA primase